MSTLDANSSYLQIPVKEKIVIIQLSYTMLHYTVESKCRLD